MAESVNCKRCLRQGPVLASPPHPGSLGEEIAAHVCADCWAEWQRAEVMVINELRLNFMDPKAQRILAEHMREFLALPAAGETVPPPE